MSIPSMLSHGSCCYHEGHISDQTRCSFWIFFTEKNLIEVHWWKVSFPQAARFPQVGLRIRVQLMYINGKMISACRLVKVVPDLFLDAGNLDSRTNTICWIFVYRLWFSRLELPPPFPCFFVSSVGWMFPSSEIMSLFVDNNKLLVHMAACFMCHDILFESLSLCLSSLSCHSVSASHCLLALRRDPVHSLSLSPLPTPHSISVSESACFF